jgi:hypothetical protein
MTNVKWLESAVLSNTIVLSQDLRTDLRKSVISLSFFFAIQKNLSD